MKRLMAVMAFSAVVRLATAGVPEISELSVVQEPQTRQVTVSYRLDVPAIVTMTFLTNGVALPAGTVRSVTGALNALVPAGTHTLTWLPYKDIPGGGKVKGADVRLTAWATNAPPLYLAVDLTKTSDNIRYYPSEAELPAPVTNDLWKTDSLLLRRIYATGVEWRMGSSQTDSLAVQTGEEPHLVTLTSDYYMGVYEFTQGQIKHVTEATCGSFATDLRNPANSMNPNQLRGDMTAGGAYDWPDKGHVVAANSILGQLRARVSQHIAFDLPTEAQWEFAARAGGPYRYGNQTDESDAACTNVAWISWDNKGGGANAYGSAHPVGLLKPNAWGLYDTLGNVGEWVLNWSRSDVSQAAEIDPVGPQTGTTRMACGGGYFWHWQYSRCSSRLGWAPDQGRSNHGFRVCAPAVIQ